jgi:hypothetical protein
MQRSNRYHATALALGASLAVSFAALLASFPALADSVADVRALVEASQSGPAWTQCETLDREVNPEADLWCGIAAVDTGHNGEGVLALERYTLHNPGSDRGRLELARAYFYAGDDVRSRTEFNTVLATNPPPAVVAGIQRYLDALSARESQYLDKLTGFVELGGGYDSNANAGVQQANIFLPVLGAVTVADFGVSQGSGFGMAAGGVQYNHPFAPGWAVYGGAAGSGMWYSEASQFNLAQLSANVGTSYHANADTFALTYAYGELYLDDSSYRSTSGAALEWRHQVTPTGTISVIPQFARIAYTGDNSVMDANFWAVSVGGRYGWLTTWQPVLNASLSGGQERNTEGRPDLGYDILGAAADVTVSPNPLWAFNAGFAWMRNDYNGPIPIVDVTRLDNNYALSLGALWLFKRHWGAKLVYQYQRNNSNLELYDYTRNVVTLKLRYDFQ